MSLKSFPFYPQPDIMDCGPTCLRMIAKYYGRNFKIQTLRDYSEINREGVSLFGIARAAEKIGFRTLAAKLYAEEIKEIDLPAILFWQQKHFVVLYKIRGKSFYIADPADRLIKLSEADFFSNWLSDTTSGEGFVLVLNPTPHFYEQDDEDSRPNWSFIARYFTKYKRLFLQLFLGLAIGSAFQLITPLLTQAIVDVGINTQNLEFISVIVIAQLALLIGRVSVDFIRSWILLHISIRVNIAILTDFLIKLMRLPISFFDTKMTGDIMQRINDQQKIESFITGSALTTLFSLFNLVIFSFILAEYDVKIFLIFLFSSLSYIGWILLFMSKRRNLNYKTFDIHAKNQSAVVQLVSGMQEIKLNNLEQQKRWEWEHIQARLLKYNIRTLALTQYQQGGATLLLECSSIFITFLSAKAVVSGALTFGSMLAIQYIIGQANSPVQQLLTFIQTYQDAYISTERLNELYEIPDEQPKEETFVSVLPNDKSISLHHVNFAYPATEANPVLQDITLNIPQGKTTAIVGISGSGKTTILKLLLRFYPLRQGSIKVGQSNLERISFETWRKQCGVVMQDGFIFSDTIEKNITGGDERIDFGRLEQAISMANLNDFVETLPLGLKTKIGSEGNGISQGQRQRILIARAVYKNPEYIFFDEATNALDANNEKIILEKLYDFFKGRTVVVVAHRLSTVTHADNIVVIDKGQIVEQGKHTELIALKGNYFELVKNQLQLGN